MYLITHRFFGVFQAERIVFNIVSKSGNVWPVTYEKEIFVFTF